MKKIISLFQRNYDGDCLVRNEVVPGAEWVLAGEGIATRKFDGTCCLVRDGKFYKRYEIKPGGKAPVGFEPADEFDEVTGKQQGWLPVGEGPEDKWHRQAWDNQNFAYEVDGVSFPTLPDGTYELLGSKIQGNRERDIVIREVGKDWHALVRHGSHVLGHCPRTFDALKAWLPLVDIEGIVWWRDLNDPDCDKVKIKKKDFGLKR